MSRWGQDVDRDRTGGVPNLALLVAETQSIPEKPGQVVEIPYVILSPLGGGARAFVSRLFPGAEGS